jgi:hypothetical protein
MNFPRNNYLKQLIEPIRHQTHNNKPLPRTPQDKFHQGKIRNYCSHKLPRIQAVDTQAHYKFELFD